MESRDTRVESSQDDHIFINVFVALLFLLLPLFLFKIVRLIKIHYIEPPYLTILKLKVKIKFTRNSQMADDCRRLDRSPPK